MIQIHKSNQIVEILKAIDDDKALTLFLNNDENPLINGRRLCTRKQYYSRLYARSLICDMVRLIFIAID
jgi:hypothetical protein